MRKVPFLLAAVVLIVLPAAVSALSLKLVKADGSLQGNFPGLHREEMIFADLDDFFRSLDFDVNWNSSLDRMEASGKNRSFRFRPGSRFVRTTKNRMTVSDPPLQQNGNLYLEVKALVNLFNENSSRTLIWNAARRQIQLRNPEGWSSEQEGSTDRNDPIGEFIEETDETDQADEKTLVVVDPGHGGRDPGAIGSNGLYEKDVVLKIGVTLREELNNHYPNLEVRLTRETDRFLPLQKRTQIANKVDADVFVSLHANSVRTSVARGFEVFTLSSEASDPSAKELAEVENSALRYEGYSKNELEDLSWILWQLRSTIHTRKSLKVARKVGQLMEKKLSVKNRGIEQAPFWVLKDARMPAILVETGFLSNPQEAQRLANQTYRKEVAVAIAEGIKNYQISHSKP